VKMAKPHEYAPTHQSASHFRPTFTLPIPIA
jgi:hypothetical protein